MTRQLGADLLVFGFLITSLLWHFVGVRRMDIGAESWSGSRRASRITFGISALLLRWRQLSFLHKAVLCFVLTLLCSPFSASVDFLIASLVYVAREASVRAARFCL